MNEECAICEGIFAYNETKIEVHNKKYCLACYEEVKGDSK